MGQTSPTLLFPEHCLPVCAGWTLPRVLQFQACPRHPVTLLKTSAMCCGFLQSKLVGLWPQHRGVPWDGWHLCHLKWGEGFGATVCCYPFPSPLCCQMGTCFVPGMLWACLSAHHTSRSLSSTSCPGAVASPAHRLVSPPCRVYKNTEELRTRIASGIITPLGPPAEKAKKEPEAEKKDPDLHRDYDPLRVPPRQPAGTRAPSW